MDVTNSRHSQWFPPYFFFKKKPSPRFLEGREAYTTLQRDILLPTSKEKKSFGAISRVPKFFSPPRKRRRWQAGRTDLLFWKKKYLPKRISGEKGRGAISIWGGEKTSQEKKTTFTFFLREGLFPSRHEWSISRCIFFFLSRLCFECVFMTWGFHPSPHILVIKKPYPGITREEYFANRHQGKKRKEDTTKKTFPSSSLILPSFLYVQKRKLLPAKKGKLHFLFRCLDFLNNLTFSKYFPHA